VTLSASTTKLVRDFPNAIMEDDMTEEKIKRRIRYEQKKSRKGRRRRWK
tara:strand:+ start:825 stop:971 length:147 start_codon:yes stop_codon:yes gene_type:complete